MVEFAYEPRAEWIKNSHLAALIQKTRSRDYKALLERSQNETEWFWKTILDELQLPFTVRPKQILSAGLPHPRWAEGAEISIAEACIDQHLHSRGKKTALIFESDEAGHSHRWSYEDLARESSYIADELVAKGAKIGDRAALLMPMSLEMVASFFGILRAGLVVIPIFSGYGAEAIASRLQDAQVRFVFVQEKTTRRGKEIPVRKTLAEILPQCPSVEHVFILKRDDFLKGHPGRKRFLPVSRPAESHALYLYTSGTTGKPKACVHTPFGVLATTGKELRYGFDIQESDRFFWYTDIGWMMGPWELTGVLQAGATVILFEGVPDYPTADRLWEIVRDHQATHLGISPTAVRVLKKSETDFLQKNRLDSLRILGSTGEPWDEESWHWFFERVGQKRCPIQNISGGTEIMGCLLTPSLLSPLKPTSLGGPALGVRAEVWSEQGKKMNTGLGHLVCLTPLPSMTKGFLHNDQKYLDTYFEKFGKSVWYHGDWAFIDGENQWFLRGRSDDTIKIAGKRVGPNEFESALMLHPSVAEVAAVGIPHEIKGECVYCYVSLKPSHVVSEALRAELLEKLVSVMGKPMAPDKIFFTEALPKTRSGKILRNTIRKIALHEPVDESAVDNLASLEAIKRAI